MILFKNISFILLASACFSVNFVRSLSSSPRVIIIGVDGMTTGGVKEAQEQTALKGFERIATKGSIVNIDLNLQDKVMEGYEDAMTESGKNWESLLSGTALTDSGSRCKKPSIKSTVNIDGASYCVYQVGVCLDFEQSDPPNYQPPKHHPPDTSDLANANKIEKESTTMRTPKTSLQNCAKKCESTDWCNYISYENVKQECVLFKSTTECRHIGLEKSHTWETYRPCENCDDRARDSIFLRLKGILNNIVQHHRPNVLGRIIKASSYHATPFLNHLLDAGNIINCVKDKNHDLQRAPCFAVDKIEHVQNCACACSSSCPSTHDPKSHHLALNVHHPNSYGSPTTNCRQCIREADRTIIDHLIADVSQDGANFETAPPTLSLAMLNEFLPIDGSTQDESVAVVNKYLMELFHQIENCTKSRECTTTWQNTIVIVISTSTFRRKGLDSDLSVPYVGLVGQHRRLKSHVAEDKKVIKIEDIAPTIMALLGQQANQAYAGTALELPIIWKTSRHREGKNGQKGKRNRKNHHHRRSFNGNFSRLVAASLVVLGTLGSILYFAKLYNRKNSEDEPDNSNSKNAFTSLSQIQNDLSKTHPKASFGEYSMKYENFEKIDCYDIDILSSSADESDASEGRGRNELRILEAS